MKLTACNLLFLSVVAFELVGSYVSTVTSDPNNTDEVPSTHIPHILSNSTVATVFEGQSVTFQCSVDELGEFVVVWKKDNDDIFYAGEYKVKKDPRISITPNKSLQIDNVHMNDAGNYICQISPALLLHHTLVVKVAPPVRTIPENGLLIVKLDEPINIGCIVSDDSRANITWTYRMEPFTEYAQDGKIFIPVSEKKHAGIYECRIHKGTDIDALGRIEVKVYYKPRVTTKTKLYYTGEGQGIEISCEVDGEPVPKVAWKRDNGRTIHFRDHYYHNTQGNSYILGIRKITRSDLGTYMCEAHNVVGRAFETIELSGLPAPVVFKNGVNDVKPDSYSMKWSVHSHSPVYGFKLKFRKLHENGEANEWIEVDIPAEKHPGPIHTHTYDITGLEPASVYEAVIITRNEFGWNNRSDIFIFTTEGGVVGENAAEDNVVATNGSHETNLMKSDVTSSSIAETRTNTEDGQGGSASSLYSTAYITTVLFMLVFVL